MYCIFLYQTFFFFDFHVQSEWKFYIAVQSVLCFLLYNELVNYLKICGLCVCSFIFYVNLQYMHAINRRDSSSLCYLDETNAWLLMFILTCKWYHFCRSFSAMITLKNQIYYVWVPKCLGLELPAAAQYPFNC